MINPVTRFKVQDVSKEKYLTPYPSPLIPRAFTLIESMVAITILSLAVAGPLTTASRAIVASQTARDQLIASYLAQEGIEYVRAMRDHEFLAAYPDVSGVAWTNFVSGAGSGAITQCRATTCTLDPTRFMGTGSGLALEQCSAGACAPLSLGGNGIYNQQSGVETPFTRTIQAFDVSGTDERIVSTVSWSFHGIPYSVVVSSHLSPWQ